MKALLHNEDETNIFYFNQIPTGKAGEFIDHYVDVMARAGVTTFLCNTNARRTNYRSHVWDAYWDGYDPAGPDTQPFLAPVPKNDLPAYRKLVDRMLEVHRQGIDYPARVVARCPARRHVAVDHAADERLPSERHSHASVPWKFCAQEIRNSPARIARAISPPASIMPIARSATSTGR